MVLINQGKKILEGAVHDIKNQFKENLFFLQFEGTLPADIKEKFRLTEEKEHSITVQLPNKNSSNELLSHLLRAGIHIQSFHEILPSLNEIFIQQVGVSNE
ncbi:MAG TPA: DUF4162 domain-containing protein [Phaeodactylibacter sp.]|nr:DUF4162 domain-containing protein [Phaeodactylibacter sp.]